MLYVGAADTAVVSYSLGEKAWGKGEEMETCFYIRAWDPEELEIADTVKMQSKESSFRGFSASGQHYSGARETKIHVGREQISLKLKTKFTKEPKVATNFSHRLWVL